MYNMLNMIDQTCNLIQKSKNTFLNMCNKLHVFIVYSIFYISLDNNRPFILGIFEVFQKTTKNKMFSQLINAIILKVSENHQQLSRMI